MTGLYHVGLFERILSTTISAQLLEEIGALRADFIIELAMIIRIEDIIASIVHGALEERCFLQSLQVLCFTFILGADGPLLAVKLEVVDGHWLH